MLRPAMKLIGWQAVDRFAKPLLDLLNLLVFAV